jgi:hypothetical protein
MKKVFAFLAVLLFTSTTQAALPIKSMSDNGAANRTRAGIPYSGAPTALTITGVSAATSQLSAGSLYSISCTTDVGIRWGDSAPTAVATDLNLKAYSVLFWSTGDASETVDTGRYVAAIQITAAGTCQIVRWR